MRQTAARTWETGQLWDTYGMGGKRPMRAKGCAWIPEAVRGKRLGGPRTGERELTELGSS